MSSIVLSLQAELLDSNCDVMQSLRKAHVIATKLHLSEFDKWIVSEMNGYKGDYTTIPDYRQLKGELKAQNPTRGWIPILVPNNKLADVLCTMPAYESISELLEIKQNSKTNNFVYRFPDEQAVEVMKMTNMPVAWPIALFISTHRIADIVEKVRNTLLEWTLTLEAEGILGEGMTFNETESTTAKGIPQQINYYGPVVHGDVTNSVLVSGEENTVTYNANDFEDFLRELRNTIISENLGKDDQDVAMELVDDVELKVKQNKKPGIIKAALTGLKDFVISVGADVTAALIVAKIQGL